MGERSELGRGDDGVWTQVEDDELTRGRAKAAVPKRKREPEVRARIRRTGVELDEANERRAAEVAERENLTREAILN